MEAEIITQAAQATQYATESGLALSFQTLFNIAVAIIAFLGGFSVNRLFKKLDDLTTQDNELSKDISELKVNLPTNYVMKEDLQRLSDALFMKLDTIEAKLDKKKDKGDIK